MKSDRIFTILTALILASMPAQAKAAANRTERKLADGWMAEHFPTKAGVGRLPFSFKLDGKDALPALGGWIFQRMDEQLDAQRWRMTLSWTDPATGLQVRCRAVAYQDYPTVEWTLWFKNTGEKESPAISEVWALDTEVAVREIEFVLHHFNGSATTAADYAANELTLKPGTSLNVQGPGRGDFNQLPYFNVDGGKDGLIVGIGWPGRWTASFERRQGRPLRLRAGMPNLDLVLKAGEEIRTPLVVLQFWQGEEAGDDWLRAQNLWRRWMWDHTIPRVGGEKLRPFTATCIDDMFPGMLSNAAGEIDYFEKYRAAGLNFDYWWIDAGWYPTPANWAKVGDWQPDPKRYPKGIREVSDYVHKRERKLVLWFEVERVVPTSPLGREHPEWLLIDPKLEYRMFDFGNLEARKWMIEHIDKQITDSGIDVYRQDLNFFEDIPVIYWSPKDPPHRTGITEIRYTMGLLEYWDELIRRHPRMFIDFCAGGGFWRADVETLRRTVPLLRSDYRMEPVGTQGHVYGISFWIPFNGTGIYQNTPYVMRSHFGPCYGYGIDWHKQQVDKKLMLKLDAEWRAIADDLTYGDYYPHTPYSLKPDVWVIWQFNRPDAGTGFVQAFRRAQARESARTVKLRGLDAAATYELRDFDLEDPGVMRKVSGKELMDSGLRVALREAPSSATIAYRKTPG